MALNTTALQRRQERSTRANDPQRRSREAPDGHTQDLRFILRQDPSVANLLADAWAEVGAPNKSGRSERRQLWKRLAPVAAEYLIQWSCTAVDMALLSEVTSLLAETGKHGVVAIADALALQLEYSPEFLVAMAESLRWNPAAKGRVDAAFFETLVNHPDADVREATHGVLAAVLEPEEAKAALRNARETVERHRSGNTEVIAELEGLLESLNDA